MIDIGVCSGGERGIPRELDQLCGYPNALQNQQCHIQAKLLHFVEGLAQRKLCRSASLDPNHPSGAGLLPS
jgi:hypothetical protein